ncbi:hypothetical protein KR222_001189 [Zaprionus bogoriensis]|nr:hypothetical protein KR222_001189 [Zaprionus bogoriensis]
MSKNFKGYPKLRFALITEDALQMLRPSEKEVKPEPKASRVEPRDDIYNIINSSVNAILEQKIRNLKLDKLDEIIESKVCELQDRRREGKKTLEGEISIDTVYDFGHNSTRSDNRLCSLFSGPKWPEETPRDTQNNAKPAAQHPTIPIRKKSKCIDRKKSKRVVPNEAKVHSKSSSPVPKIRSYDSRWVTLQ